MSNAVAVDPAPYEQIRKDFLEHPVRQVEVPTEFSISLPVPTLRWSVPAFAGFAGPAARVPHQPLQLAAPDRWWALNAWTGRLVAYGLTAAIPFTERLEPSEAVADRGGRSIAQLNEDLQVLDSLMETAAPQFLAGSAGTATARRDLLEALTAVVTPDVLPWYRALAQDFFAWLEG